MKLRAIQLLSRYIGILMLQLAGYFGVEFKNGEVDNASAAVASAVVGLVFLLIDHGIHKKIWAKIKPHLPFMPPI